MNKKVIIAIGIVLIFAIIGLFAWMKWGKSNSNVEVSDVNTNKLQENISIEVIEDSITRESVEIVITDNIREHSGWDEIFNVQERVNGEWQDVKCIQNGWSLRGAYTGDDNKLNQKLNIEEHYGKLLDGVYRIGKRTYDSDIGYVYIYSNEFEIK